MEKNKTVNGPIPRILSLKPGDDIFDDTREQIRGVWISNEHWTKLERTCKNVHLHEAIKEANPGLGSIEGVWLDQEQLAIIENNLLQNKEAGLISEKTIMTEEDWKERNESFKNNPIYIRSKAIYEEAKRKRIGELSKY